MNKKKYLIISIVAILTLIIAIILAIGNIATTSINIKQGREIMSNSSTTGTKGTIINVPIDCRPSTRSDFQELVEAAGYNYIEINRSLDSYQGNNGSAYIKGDASLEQTSLEQQVKENNNSDTTVIINLSTYFFGGIKAARDPSNYTDAKMQENLNNLKNLITKYNNPKYYVSMSIPRTLPDLSISSLSGGVNANTKVAGLSGSDETFEQAFMDWQYLHYIQVWKGTTWLPEKTEAWAVNFKNTYNTQTTAYLNVYDSVYKYINDNQIGLSKMAKDLGFELILNTESNALPDSILDENIDSEYISSNVPKTFYWDTDSNGQKVRYSGLKQCVEHALQNYSALTIIHGVENINDVILAKEIARKNNVTISYNYVEPLTGNTWSTASGSALNFEDIYDEISESEILKERTDFINKDRGSGSLTVDLYVTNKAHTLLEGEKSRFIERVTSESSADATGILDLKNLGNSTEYYDVLVKNDAIFKNPVYVDLSAITNASSKALATTAVFASLNKDFKNATTINDELKTRLSTFTNIQLRNVLIDGVYYKKIKESGNYTANSSDLKNRIIMSEGTTSSSSANKNLLTMFQNTVMKIAGKTYQVSGVSITNATNPLNRNSEVYLTSNIETLNIQGIINVTSVTITPKNPTIKIGETIQLTATTAPDNDSDITWTSSSNSIATVSSKGKVTAIKEGSVKIKAISSNGVEGSTIVEVSNDGSLNVTSVTITPQNPTLKASETLQLTATTSPDKDTNIIWESSDISVATVDNTGKITAIKEGTATIKAVSSNGVEGTTIVKVESKKGDPSEVTAVDVTPRSPKIKVGETIQMTATTLPVKDTNIRWESVDSTIATVDSTGKVTALKEGVVRIKAFSSNGIEGSTVVEIEANQSTPGGSTDNPGSGTDNPGGSTDNPGSGTDNPGGSTDNPGSGTDNPGSGTDNPGGSTDNPGSGTDTPGGSTDNPGSGTNTPGGSTTTPTGNTNNGNKNTDKTTNGSTTISGTTNSANSGTASKLPYTGFLNRNLGILLTVIVASLGVSITSFIKYRKINV